MILLFCYFQCQKLGNNSNTFDLRQINQYSKTNCIFIMLFKKDFGSIPVMKKGVIALF